MISEIDCEKIFDTYRTLSVAPEYAKAREMTEDLSIEELELAAQRSYAYTVTLTRTPTALTDNIRFATAMQEANRHLDGVDDMKEALTLLKATLQFHKTQKTHLYRTCLQEDFAYANPDDARLACQRRSRLLAENRDVQTMVVRGHDRQKNAVWVALPRKQQGKDPQAFVDVLIYTIERCAATTEAQTHGRREQMVAILDCKHSSAPSIKAVKMGIYALQAYYPGRLKNLIVLDLNYILQGIYNCVKPFLDPETRQKFLIVKGTKAKESALSLHIDAAQLQPNMMRGGKLIAPADGERFVKDVPFHCLYDEISCQPVPRRVSHITVGIKEKKIPAPVKSPRTYKSKSLAVGSMSRCMKKVSVTPISS